MLSEKALCADNQQASCGEIPNEYLTGFVDGEGCFYVGFSKRTDLPLGWQIITEFHLSQNPGGKNILETFRERLGCGYLKFNHPKSERDKAWVLVVKSRKQIKQRLLPFFAKYPLYSNKAAELRVFKEVLFIIETKEHLRFSGFEKIVNLVFQLSRKTNKRYSREYLLATASETIRQTLD